MFIFLSVLITLIILFILIWYTNLGGLKEKVLIHLVVKMRVSPKRLKNVKSPLDYGMDYQDVNILTPDNIRLSAWLISPKNNKDHTIIINHALTTTRYGALKGLDNVSVEYLPMVKHLYDEGYNVLFYDQRGQGDSDGGLGKNQVGKQAPVGAGMTEWQDVIGAVQYVKHHPKLKNNQISFIAHCMGANALFLAWHKEPLLFNQFNIQSIIAIQPTISIKMFGRLLKSM